MRAFAIADASRRKARPVAALFWEHGPAGEIGRFSLAISSGCTERDLPLSLSFCLHKPNRCASARESLEWVRSRIVPENRQNIAEVLESNGIAEYDEVTFLSSCEGRSSDDDFFAYEIELPEQLADELSMMEPGAARADRLLSEIERKRDKGKVLYSVVELPDNGASCASETPNAETPTPAQRIGRQIRRRRLDAGLTQAQLATRAGIAQAVISRVESGAGNPTIGLLEDIAFTLDSELDVTLAT